MFYNKYLNNNKILFTYKKLINIDIKKAFDVYLHLPKYFKEKYLYSRYKCRHELTLFYNNHLMKLEERKPLLNDITNLGLIIEFLIDNDLKKKADDIINKLKKIWCNVMYERFVFFMNEYRTAYTLKKKKNIKTKKYELIKVYDLEKRCRFLQAIQHIEYNVLDTFNQPIAAFTLRWYRDPYFYYLFRFELESIDVSFILNHYIDENSFIRKSDYYFFYEGIQKSYGIVYINNLSNFLLDL